MSESIEKCAREGCDEVFEKNTHNQKYCTNKCLKLATNFKLTKNYHSKKARRAGEERFCATTGCTKKLSRYNDNPFCFSCKENRETESNAALAYVLMNSSVI